MEAGSWCCARSSGRVGVLCGRTCGEEGALWGRHRARDRIGGSRIGRGGGGCNGGARIVWVESWKSARLGVLPWWSCCLFGVLGKCTGKSLWGSILGVVAIINLGFDEKSVDYEI